MVLFSWHVLSSTGKLSFGGIFSVAASDFKVEKRLLPHPAIVAVRGGNRAVHLAKGLFGFASQERSATISSDMNMAVFLDRDGTLIQENDYLCDPDQVIVLPGAMTALHRLQQAGFKLIIVTNQSGVGRGYFTLADVEAVNARVVREFGRQGVNFQKIYFAPEAPEQPSRGRKPSPQFLFDARDEFGLDLARSFMIGDKLVDLECGWNAGVKQSLLVRTGYGAEQERKYRGSLSRAVVVDDLPAAADWILQSRSR